MTYFISLMMLMFAIMRTMLDVLIRRLEHAVNKAVNWFKCNYMKSNSDKCHILICGHKYECILVHIGNEMIIESHQEKLLGILIDSKLTFENHVNNYCKKAAKKLNALDRQTDNVKSYHTTERNY